MKSKYGWFLLCLLIKISTTCMQLEADIAIRIFCSLFFILTISLLKHLFVWTCCTLVQDIFIVEKMLIYSLQFVKKG